MSFASIEFIYLITLVLLLFHRVGNQGLRMYLLLGANITFYAFGGIEYLPILVFVIVVSFYSGHWVADEKTGKIVALVSVSLLVASLLTFKYFIFFEKLFCGELDFATPTSSLVSTFLPIGISFYVFQAISYIVDIRRRALVPEKSLVSYAVYISFFPQLIAGPILRGNQVLPQLKNFIRLKNSEVNLGLRRIAEGFFLKIVVADQLAVFVDQAFREEALLLGPLDVLTMAFGFGAQIYLDFAAYSHIAIGCALLFGLRFPENFRFPFFACSPKEFWRRWHISLSNWVKDYIYIPLMRSFGYSIPALAGVVSLLLTWFLMGLWHGASLNYVVWGLYHALLIFMWRVAFGSRLAQFRWLSWMIFLPLMMLGWLPFRAATLDQSVSLVLQLFDFAGGLSLAFSSNFYLLVFVVYVFHAIFYGLSVIGDKRSSPRRNDLIENLLSRFSPLYVGCLTGASFIFSGSGSSFIYFQF